MQTNGVTAISASWVVPAVQCNFAGYTSNQISEGIAVWVGFDGIGNVIPEQVGSMSFCLNGSPSYWAWEDDQTHGTGNTAGALAAFGDTSAGDQMTASIAYLGNNEFQLIIKDLTADRSRAYTAIINNAPRASAEWIVEAFYNMNTGKQATLPGFQPITFTDCAAAVNGVSGSITQNNAQPLNMVDSNGNIIVTAENLNQAGTSIQVAEAS